MSIIRSKLNVEISEDIKSFPRFMLKKFVEYGNDPAIVDSHSNRSYTFKQLTSLIKECGSGLLRSGFKPRETLAIILPNIPEFPIIVYGATAVGGIVTTLNPSYTVDEFVYQLRDSGASYIVTVPQLSAKVKEAASKLNIQNIFILGEADGFKLIRDDGSLFRFYEPKNWKEEVMLLPYSSGTTGLPKGVMITHFNLLAHMSTVIAKVTKNKNLPDNKATLGLVPFYHMYGLSIMLGIRLSLGSCVVCINGFKPLHFLKTVQDYKIASMGIVPPIAVFLAKHPSVLNFDLSHVESISCGAAPLGEDVILQLKKRFPKVKDILQGYGLTETSPSMITQQDGDFKLGSVGTLNPNTQAKVPPAELEDVLLSHPQITDAAVIGIPDKQAGELPKAFVVTKTKLTAQAVKDFVSKKVAPHKKLRGGVEFVESIPKNPSGKIMRRYLREQERKKMKSLKHKL